jgi:hypothetical protein
MNFQRASNLLLKKERFGSMDNIDYVAIIGDLIRSREFDDRSHIQTRLEDTLQTISHEYADDIHAKFIITIGDEFQGLVKRTFPLQDFLRLFNESFGKDFPTRFGIGLGKIITQLKYEAIGMDGSSFHHARAALNDAKKQSQSIVFKGFEMNTSINAFYQFVHNIESNWNERQREVIALYRKIGNQVSVAHKLEITKQSVNDILNASQWDFFQKGWSGIKQLMSFSREDNSD